MRSTTHKVLLNLVFGCGFHDLKYFKVGFLVFLEFIINSTLGECTLH